MPDLASIKIDPVDLDRVRASLNPQQMKQALFQAVKRTTSAAVSIVVDQVKEQTGIKDKYARRAVASKVDGSDADNPVGTVEISKKATPLTAFKLSYTKSGGVAVELGDAGGLIFRHGFVATVEATSKSGDVSEHKGAFVRTRGSRGANKHGGLRVNARGIAWRLPIKQLYGPSVYSIIQVPEIQKAVIQQLGDRLTHEVDGQIRRFIEQK